MHIHNYAALAGIQTHDVVFTDGRDSRASAGLPHLIDADQFVAEHVGIDVSAQHATVDCRAIAPAIFVVGEPVQDVGLQGFATDLASVDLTTHRNSVDAFRVFADCNNAVHEL